jgi:hypothetical protein
MKKGDGVIVMVLALVAFSVAWAIAQEPPRPPSVEPEGVVSLGPVEHVGGFGNTGEPAPLNSDGKALCRDAPLNSFGSRCEGYTWVRDSSGNKIERRIAVGKDPLDLNFGFLGFL